MLFFFGKLMLPKAIMLVDYALFWCFSPHFMLLWGGGIYASNATLWLFMLLCLLSMLFLGVVPPLMLLFRGDVCLKRHVMVVGFLSVPVIIGFNFLAIYLEISGLFGVLGSQCCTRPRCWTVMY